MFDNSPYYRRLNEGSGLVDIISSSLDSFTDRLRYASRVSRKSVSDDLKVSYKSTITVLDYARLGTPIDKALKKTGGYLYKNKKILSSVVLATAASMAANYVATYISNDVLSCSPKTVSKVSYGFEVGSMVLAYCTNYITNARKEGFSWTRIGVELAVTGIVGFLFSYYLYKPYMKDNFMEYAAKNLDMTRQTAAVIAQGASAVPFYFLFKGVDKGMDKLDKKYHFKDMLVRRTDAVVEGVSEFTEKAVDKVEDAFEDVEKAVQNGFNGIKDGFENIRDNLEDLANGKNDKTPKPDV